MAVAHAPMQARLLSVATELFAEKGFDATSVQEVVERAQVTKGALYHYFDSKQDLLYEIYHSIISQQLADLERILAAGEPAGATLRAIIVNLVETTAARVDQAMVFGREMHRLDQTRMAAGPVSRLATKGPAWTHCKAGGRHDCRPLEKGFLRATRCSRRRP